MASASDLSNAAQPVPSFSPSPPSWRVPMPEDFELIQFTEDWWRGYAIYEGEEGKAYVTHVFNHISKEHLVDFLRDAINEFNQKE